MNCKCGRILKWSDGAFCSLCMDQAHTNCPSPCPIFKLDKPDLSDPPPIPCKGYEIHTPDAHEYDCSYEYAGDIVCEDCIVNGGKMDPRTGKKYRHKKT